MELEITTKCKVKKPIEKYEVTFIFDASETNNKVLFNKDEEKTILNWVKLFKEYKNKLSEDWNEWCNTELEFIMEVSEEFSLGFSTEDIEEIWLGHPEYQYLDTPNKIKIHYYNEDGIKFNVKVV